MMASMAARPADAPPAVGHNLLIDTTTAKKVENVARNLERDKIRVIKGVIQLIK